MPTKKVDTPWEDAAKKAADKPAKKKAAPVKKATKKPKHSIRVVTFGTSIVLPFETEQEVKTAMTIITARCSRGQPATIVSGKDEYTFVPSFGVLISDA